MEAGAVIEARESERDEWTKREQREMNEGAE